MNPLVAALFSLNCLVGGQEGAPYVLFEDRGWYLLDDSFLREYEQHLPESLPKVKLDEEA